MISWLISRLTAYLWPIVAAVGVSLVLAVGVQTKRVTWAKADVQECKNASAVEHAGLVQAALQQSETNRAIEAAREAKQKEITDAADKQLAQARADAAIADAAAGRLSARVVALVAQARAAAANPAAFSASAPAADPVGMLAELQRRADEAAGIFARIADERGAAGAACEAEYQALTEKP